ncbi:MAG TPA: hypothetical protein VM489_15075 [Burkholderiales bacterium]|nr:hypothetical protein [Burkholderiales bacterium]
MDRLTVEQRTLCRAQSLLGSTGTLARVLAVRVELLEQWLKGLQPVPGWVFLRAVDIVNDGGRSLYSAAWSASSASTPQ